MVVLIFCPDFNVQVALGIVTVMWAASLSRVSSNDAKENRVIPYISSLSDCDWELQIDQSQHEGQSVTIATKYNETFFSETDLMLESSSLYESTWNTSEVAHAVTEGFVSMQLLPRKGDVLTIRKLSNTQFTLLLDNLTSDQYNVYVLGYVNNTTVNIYSEKVPNDSLSFTSELFETMQVNTLSQIMLNRSHVRDGTFINSTEPIGLFVTSASNQTCNHSDVTYEMVPSISQMGTRFHVYIPQQSIFLCSAMSLSDCELNIHYQSSSTRANLEKHMPKLLNFTDTEAVTITTTAPIQILCSTWIPADNGEQYKNQFFLLPFSEYSQCSFIVVKDCIYDVCAIVFSENSSGILQISSLTTNITWALHPSAVFHNQDNDIHIWEIKNLTNGLYNFQSENDTIMVFKIDTVNGRFYQVEPFPTSLCNNSDFNELSTTLGSIVSTIDVSTDSQTVIPTGSSTTEEAGNSSVTTSTGSNNTTFTMDSNVTKSTPRTIDRYAQFPFLYGEIHDDDKMLNEYMIAVIVSLCTAIFAVIAVISTFLLLEVLARRKQLRNSKIRPMVS